MTTPTIKSLLAVQYSNDGMVDLYKLDCSSFGGSTYYFSPQCYVDGSAIYFGGQAYTRIPIGIESLDIHATTQSLPQPTLSVSNVGGVLLSAILTLGDLVGCKVTHWKTKVSYLDGQANADSTKFIGPSDFYVFQKTIHNNTMIQWSLASPMDRPGLMMPARQVLKDQGINAGIPIYFPGVSPYRINPSAP